MEINQKTIRQQQIQSLLDKEGVNLAVENLNSIFDFPISSPIKSKINNDKWFGEECKNIRKKLRNLSNQKQRDPENNQLLKTTRTHFSNNAE